MPFVVRFIHVGSVSFLLGGALLIGLLLLVSKAAAEERNGRQALLDVMKVYEWGSWAALALVVVTGVGNLARFGEGLPAPDSEWGREFSLKLVLVAAFLLVSLVRTVSVTLVQVRCAGAGTAGFPSALARLYWLTAALVTTVVAIAVALAHF